MFAFRVHNWSYTYGCVRKIEKFHSVILDLFFVRLCSFLELSHYSRNFAGALCLDQLPKA